MRDLVFLNCITIPYAQRCNCFHITFILFIVDLQNDFTCHVFPFLCDLNFKFHNNCCCSATLSESRQRELHAQQWLVVKQIQRQGFVILIFFIVHPSVAWIQDYSGLYLNCVLYSSLSPAGTTHRTLLFPLERRQAQE